MRHHPNAQLVTPPRMGAPELGYVPLGPAPGIYVHEKLHGTPAGEDDF